VSGKEHLMSGWFKDKEHLVRMASLFAVGIGAFLVLQHVFVPPGFGQFGHYRAGALVDARSPALHPVHYAGRAACEGCHDAVVTARKGSRHERIGCEACHGAAARHAARPSEAKPPLPDPRAVCIRCHSASASRPKAFPQVVVADHADAGPCTSCHQPHAPKVS
jgi:hypothetical protein